MMAHLGWLLVGWLGPMTAWTALLLLLARALDRALERRVHASTRLALYAPVLVRLLVPLGWGISLPESASVLALPVDRLALAAPFTSRGGGGALVALVYALGVVLGAALRLARRQALATSLEKATPVTAPPGPCPVLEHAEDGPCVVGVLSPRVVVPRALLGDPNGKALACVLRHEFAHVLRRDPWLLAVVEALLVVFWPVVPLWLAAARVRHLMELACDERALRDASADERRHYGHVLLDLAEGRPLAVSGAALSFGATLRSRVEAIALAAPWSGRAQGLVVGTAVVALVACSSGGTASNAPTSGGVHPASASSVDEYGYQYETDTPAAAANPGPSPSSARNADGRIAPEAIQSVVRGNFGRFRSCYEASPRAGSGIVSVRFIIDPSGAVRDAVDDGSTLADRGVVQCVVQGFAALAFPPPQGGYVTVVYPIQFAPGD